MIDKTKKISDVGAHVNNCLVITVEDEIDDEAFDHFCTNILRKLEKKELGAAILDFTKVTMLDGFRFLKLSHLTKAMQLMGIKVVWSQLSPGVVSCIMDFGMDATGIQFSSTVESGLSQLNSLT